ncbi:extracellular protease inhibitor 10 isoform X2 [Ixodes scapularis]|uniref:extracellular protease inhibitor 10 isoform X2 n=1 Tax=Ixodes scapularis TaxID=6945 RepID=UPI001A9F743C|nr:extracellular protease inhibitor 10 isoform X2 [Ixodes scapularis]
MSAKVRLLLSLLALLVGNAVAAPLDESEASPVSSSQDQAPVPDLPTTASPPSALSPQGTEPKGTGACGGVCKEQFPVPVCGSDGRIYHSECVMKQMTCRRNPVTVVDWEKCRGQHPLCPDKCLDIYDPVCGRDGKFYPNLCIMQRRNCGKRIGTQDLAVCIAKVRESRRLDACPKTCPEIYEPVCGSNGEVYLNECVFRQENCGRSTSLVPLGRCVSASKCPKRCLPILDPVCGSDGQRYLNHCRMQEANCGKNVVVMPKGFCS